MNPDEQKRERHRRINDLTNQIIRAQIFFDLWWALAGDPRASHLEGMNRHPEFFRFAQHGFLIAMVNQMMMPFDQNRDAISLKNLIKGVDQSNAEAVLAKSLIENVITRAKPIVKKVKLLRDECFAHRKATSSYNEVFRQAGVMPREFRDMIQLALGSVNRLRHAEGMEVADFAHRPGDDLNNLLRHLQSLGCTARAAEG